MLSLLWIRREDYLLLTKAGEILIQNRNEFLSKRIYTALSGYVHNQVNKMKKNEFHGYMGEKRKELVTRFGYDTKAAAHAVRLLKMGCELFRDGQVNVFRADDAVQLLEIKRGNWEIERVRAYCRDLEEEMRQYKNQSDIPDEVNMERINQIAVEITETAWEIRDK